jgi:hypothetical protein
MILQDKLEQEQLKLSQNVADRKVLEGVGDGIASKIESLMDEIAEAEVTYSIGDRFKDKASGDKYILASVADYKADLIKLKSGARQTSVVEFTECSKISKQIMTSILCSFTRYWDDRKQEKV